MPAPVWMHTGASDISVESFMDTIRQKNRPEHDVLLVAPRIAREIEKALREPSAFFWLRKEINTVDGLDIITIEGLPGAIIAQRGDLFSTVADHKGDTADNALSVLDETETLK